MARSTSRSGMASTSGSWLVRDDALAEHDGDPAGDVEQLLVVAEDAAVLAEQLDLVLQRVGDRHVAEWSPERLGRAGWR